MELLLNNDTKKIIIHCSAGVGRTGTTIALVNLMLDLRAQIERGATAATIKIRIFSMVRKIREQRQYLVQTED